MSTAVEVPVVVLMGGRSPEREVSLASGRAVLEALESARAAGEGPAAVIPVEIGRDGRWSVGGLPSPTLAALGALPPEAIYFLALHGGEGEDGTVQALLAQCGRAHTGSGVAASALCMDKHAARLVLAAAGLAIAPGRLVTAREWAGGRAGVLDALAPLGGEGWFVKPRRGGSSLGMHLVLAAADLPAALEDVLAGDDALVEARVPGTEATCAVLGNRDDELRALTPVEIVPRTRAFFDYVEKYDDERGALELCPPRSLSARTCERLRVLAVRAHAAAGCDGYSRADFIVPAAEGGEGQGEPVFLEVNTLPGLTRRSLSPRAAAVEGLDFPHLCLEIVHRALSCAPGGAV